MGYLSELEKILFDCKSKLGLRAIARMLSCKSFCNCGSEFRVWGEKIIFIFAWV